jgi:hypothetical protein
MELRGTPFVSMMETSHLWQLNYTAEVRSLNYPWLRGVLLKRQVSPGIVVVAEIAG